MARIPQTELAQIEELLVTETPTAVKSAKIKDPVYCLRIWYYGTSSSGNAVPSLMLVKESTRRDFLANDKSNALHKIWCADEVTNPGQAIQIELASPKLQSPYAKWYQYLCDVENDEELKHLRNVVQRAARKLNVLNWKEFAPVTDDFVVFPADGAHTFFDDRGDLSASATPEQLKMLRSKELL